MSWRVKAFEKMDSKDESQLFYTAPMSISEKEFKILRAKIRDLISDFTKNLVNEEPEILACLNIDLFKF